MPLDRERLRQAGVKALQNAEQLIEEAEILYERERWPRVVFLCQIAGEELGKCFISLTAIVRIVNGTFEEDVYRKRCRTHRSKTGMTDFFESLVFSEQPLTEFLEQRKGRIERFESLKLASLYTDFVADVPVSPNELIGRELASGMLLLAQNRVKHFGLAVKPLLDRVLLESLSMEEFSRFEAEHPELLALVNRRQNL